MHELETELRITRRRRSRVGAFVIVVTLMTLFGSLFAELTPVHRFLRGEVDWRGHRVYAPPHPVDAAALGGIDLERVHTELLPAWVLASGKAVGGGNEVAEVEAFERLTAAVSPDANLTDLLQSLRGHVAAGGLRTDPKRALYLVWAWSTYLDRAGHPYLVQGSILRTDKGRVFATTILRTHPRGDVTVGDDNYRVRVGTRVDGTNVVERYLGAAGRDQAIVVVDRVREFALTELWLLLEPANDHLSPGRAVFADAVRQEARARLPDAAFRQLRSLAVPRWSIVATVTEIHERRARCGAGLRINHVPWFGFEGERIVALRAMAQRDAAADCPAITLDEVDRLERASHKLLAAPGLEDAVGALVAWAVEHVAVHEARHLADHRYADGFDVALSCGACSEAMGVTARAELSGYLASIAWSPSPATALYQACRAIAEDGRLGHGHAVKGPHAEAMALLQRRLGHRCTQGPPQDLAARARGLERAMLGRSEPIALGEGWPRTLPL